MSIQSEYFLKTKSSVVQLELIEFNHPNTGPFRFVRNKVDGVSAFVDSAYQTFNYYPMKISQLGVRDNLDSGFKIEFGDVNLVLAAQLDAIRAASGFGTKPTVRYWSFRSDDLAVPLYGPFTFEITTISFTKQGAMFEAHAPFANINKTGEVYSLARFPMLRGFL